MTEPLSRDELASLKADYVPLATPKTLALAHVKQTLNLIATIEAMDKALGEIVDDLEVQCDGETRSGIECGCPYCGNTRIAREARLK